MMNTLTMNNANAFHVSTKQVLIMLALAISAIILMVGFDALAATATEGVASQFEEMWEDVQAIATGAPGKILMLIMVMGVVFFSTVKPNLVGFAGCVIAVLVLANASKIINGSLTASVFDAVPQALHTATAVLPVIGM